MKTIRTMIMLFGIVAMVGACTPNEDVEPQYKDGELEKFEVKSTEGEESKTDPLP